MKKLIVSISIIIVLCSCNQFDQDTWLKEPEKRHVMMDSLTRQYPFKGLTDNEVISLLGDPAEERTEPSRQFLYDMGSAGLGVKVTLLELTFDENGKVVSHDIIYR
ncbi:hypothetical protein [Paenibacillus sp. PL2-23]|uniref:hypothetical protein n=1 Tax=Paenibacillus sp. PL2-23 TaxID=2100729 RepID=UPI0030F64EDB